MSEKEFVTFLGIVIVPETVRLISENGYISIDDAINQFYNSKVYSLLEREETKFWHYSPLTLCNLFLQEKENGEFEFPEEAA